MPDARNGFKICSRCRESLPTALFHKNKGSSDGFNNQCAECRRISQKAWRDKNPTRHAKYRYGLEPDEYQRMIDAAGGHCTACGDKAEKLEIDHCHKTGRVRALLCKMCNIALGQVDDSIEKLEALVKYLQKHAQG